MYDILVYILKIIYYFLFVFVLYRVALHSFKKGKTESSKSKFPLIAFIILSVFFGYYAVICGRQPPASDRLNYSMRFANEAFLGSTKLESLGLYWIEVILHLFTYNPSWLFFVMSVLYFGLTIIAYNSYDDDTPLILLLLGISSYLTLSFYMLKQALACALIAIAVAMYFKNKKILCVLSSVLAIMFHESAWIIVPVFIAMYFSKYKMARIIEYFGITLFLIFFPQINKVIISLVIKIIPEMAYQLENYLNSSGEMNITINFITILKGVPYYVLTIFAFVNRKKLVNKIRYYDEYLFLSFFVSITNLFSLYMYWMYRFSMFFYFPILVFAENIYYNTEKSKDRLLFSISTFCLLFILTLRTLIQFYFWYGGI